ncbi:hypothetical protein HK097_002668, partial [Rhizophlyctis rosea]
MHATQRGPGYNAKNLPPDFADIVRNALAGGDNANSDSLRVVQVESVEGSVRSKYSATDIRGLSLLSYFHQIKADPTAPVFDPAACTAWWNFQNPLSARIPYKVPFTDLKVKFLNGEVPISQTLHALNGTIVALVRDSTTYGSPYPDQASPVAFEPNEAETPSEQTDPSLSLRT